MKYLIGLLLLIFTTNIYAKELLAVVNGNEITTDVAHTDFFNMDVEQKKIAIKRLVEKELAIEYGLNSDMVKSKKFIDTFNHIIKVENGKDLASTLKDKENKYTNEQLRSKKGLLAFDMILDEKAQELKPDTNTLKKYYEINKNRYDTKKMYELLHIIVNTKEEALEIEKALNNSTAVIKTFQEIASKKSLAPTKDKNGYLGQFDYEAMPKELQEAVKNLTRNQYSKPFKTDFGYELVYVMGYQDEVKRGYKESQINVKDDYTRESVINWAFEQINKLKEKAEIKIIFKG
ncbi:peptidylprolyl isomerase [Halarcobacter ebronensis]|uniref:peptidylprolyl isomerase n=1 Tax=Halarcobacter ebronensis TaxID=1462615 RepID=A0A4Q1ANV8_9BACT|nr:peptidylprolyl isomerase [Halarcobacter ebronensis]QKF82678.1 PPIC-type PPIASE domain-containing protein [Halarcobacter ebronensis]RXK02100.1 hypothetical protein CRV07_14400 [Halarcobacter ebronensis]